MTTEELDELERAAKAATPGPWKHSPGEDGASFMSFSGPNRTTIIGGCGCCMSPYGISEDSGHTFYNPCEADYANAGLIALMRNNIDVLIAAARENAALRERVIEECAKVAESAQPALLEDATPMNGLEQIAFRMGRRAAVSAIRTMK